ncbi:isocitrate lyase/phosphoenolpyruvate mutase family protein [Bradyrhizobium sp. DASA03005]|uniref:isocitrate lyase/phosphoenolpyruvate mutase family protein n=1 Tax=Bradyrhizobium sp. SPXBL-02 TaxID=3395912 RepID=UPI003F710E92
MNRLVQSVERMVDSTELAVLVDGDGGFGNFNNARLLARKLRQARAAGVSLEDSCFPKLNSLIGERHPLADIDELRGHLRAVNMQSPKILFSWPGSRRRLPVTD